MSNQVLFSLNESSITIDMTPPIRRVAADASSSIPLDYISSNEQINTNFYRPSFSLEQFQSNPCNLIKQSIKKRNSEPSTILRERSTSSSSTTSSLSKSSNNDSLRSFSPNPSVNEDDEDEDDASSNDDTNHQWDLNQLASHISMRQLSKLINNNIHDEGKSSSAKKNNKSQN
jgi:hypothetical protein